MEREHTSQMSREDQHGRARMDQLLRAVLPDSVDRVTQKHRQILGALGDAKVQATEGQPHARRGSSWKAWQHANRSSSLTGD